MLNLGCGTRMHLGWNNLDFSPYARLAPYRRVARLLKVLGLLSAERYARLLQIDPQIICWDLRYGAPFPAESFDVVYHSHVLEHIDRQHAPVFLRECYRVLKPGGRIRVVVPDLQALVAGYCATLPASDDPTEDVLQAHELAIFRLLDQLVRTEPAGTTQQRRLVQRIEKIVRGDARRVGELHRWMYDRHTLRAALQAVQFVDVGAESAWTSHIPGWSDFGLDVNADGSAYIPESLYMEGIRPASA
jgi:SAM-dependent methyltransferase